MNLDALLQTGSWPTMSRRNDSDRPAQASAYISPPTSPTPMVRPFSFRRVAPPAPSVEDVAEEQEDVPNRGEIDQFPIILFPTDSNDSPDRRWVLSAGPTDPADGSERSASPEPEPVERHSATAIARPGTRGRGGSPWHFMDPPRRNRSPIDDQFMLPPLHSIAGGRERAYLDFSNPRGYGKRLNEPNDRESELRKPGQWQRRRGEDTSDRSSSTATYDSGYYSVRDGSAVPRSRSPSSPMSSTFSASRSRRPSDGNRGFERRDSLKGETNSPKPWLPGWSNRDERPRPVRFGGYDDLPSPSSLYPEYATTPIVRLPDPQVRTYLGSEYARINRPSTESSHETRLAPIFNCHWKTPTVPGKDGQKHAGFFTIQRLVSGDFRICKDCHDVVIGATGASSASQFAPIPTPSRPVTCSFGTNPWYQVALLMALKRGLPDLRLLQNIARIEARERPCPGNLTATRNWRFVLDPRTNKPIQGFKICGYCSQILNTLMPNLAGLFESPGDIAPERGTCEMRCTPGRRRFSTYFDILEKASDNADARRSYVQPNTQQLVDRIRDVALCQECPGEEPVEGRRWHVMNSLPDFTVCEECFDEVVWPILEDNSKESITRDFIRRRQFQWSRTKCQLSTDTMREVFRRACRRDDLAYLEAKLKEEQQAHRQTIAQGPDSKTEAEENTTPDQENVTPKTQPKDAVSDALNRHAEISHRLRRTASLALQNQPKGTSATASRFPAQVNSAEERGTLSQKDASALDGNIAGVELLKRAISAQNRHEAESLLESRFNEVAQGEFIWLTDLKDTDFTVSDMTGLLFDTAQQAENSLACEGSLSPSPVHSECSPSPEPASLRPKTHQSGDSTAITESGDVNTDLMEAKKALLNVIDHHQIACAHRIPDMQKGLEFAVFSHTNRRDKMQHRVATLCGIAGLVPEKGQQNGPKGLTVTGSTASVLYGSGSPGSQGYTNDSTSPSQNGVRNIIAELKGVLAGLKAAAIEMQQAGFCCNEFTILAESHDIPDFVGPAVRMKTVLFRDFKWLDETIARLEATMDSHLVAQSPTHRNSTPPGIDDILKIASQEGRLVLRPLSFNERLQICSLALQVLTMGLLLYSQAYTGQIHPFFLTSPITTVQLHGAMASGTGQSVVVERRKLACLGDMVGDEVFVFRAGSSAPASSPENGEKLYISGSCAQLADLWGPGYALGSIPPTSRFYLANLVGFYIRGGIIRPCSPQGQVPRLFHWAPESADQPVATEKFSYGGEILIGTMTECQPTAAADQEHVEKTMLTGAGSFSSTATTLPVSEGWEGRRPLVTTNTACPVRMTDSRRESEPYLCTLGTSPDWWSLTEVQGIAAMNAPYFTLQGAFAMTKQSGIPLKRILLDRWAGDENLSLFDEPWGLQVSLCTGVARRVPLRALVEAPLIRFIDSLNIPGWEAMKPQATLALREECPGFSQWIAKLTPDEKQCMRTVCCRLLHLLKDTGFDSSGKNFSILWPHGTDARFCVRIRPDKDKDQLWCSMLQDSEWCASFAVISNQCLETGAHACRRGIVAPWRGGAMLSTVVCPNLTGGIPRPMSPSPGPSTLIIHGMQRWELLHNKPYWVGKQGSQIWVVARKGAKSVTELQVKRNRFPTSAFLWPDRILREKPDVTFHGEDVFVLHR